MKKINKKTTDTLHEIASDWYITVLHSSMKVSKSTRVISFVWFFFCIGFVYVQGIGLMMKNRAEEKEKMIH